MVGARFFQKIIKVYGSCETQHLVVWNAENTVCSQCDLAQSQKWGGAFGDTVEVKRLMLQQRLIVQRVCVILCQRLGCQKDRETESGVPIRHQYRFQCQIPGSIFFTNVYLYVHCESR